MRLYLDDDLASALLSRLLGQASHDVQVPGDVNMTGQDDAIQLAHAIGDNRVLLSGNHDDFEKLHYLVIQSAGHHPGILIVRRDNDPKRDLTRRGIVVALQNLKAARVAMEDSFYVLNHWR
jgi:predicted nuclease of predicted toxin-antitoxin system